MNIRKAHSKFLFSILGVSLVSLALVSIFFVTRAGTPSTSELAFIEHSLLGEEAGSVVPASCASGANHFAGDCVPVVNVDVGDQSRFMNFQFTGDTVRPGPGGTLTLTWYSQGATSCTGWSDDGGSWSGAKALNGAWSTNLGGYICGPGSSVVYTYSLTCSGSGKSFTRSTRVVAETVDMSCGG